MSRSKCQTRLTRLMLALGPRDIAQLDKTARITEATSRTEVIRRAIRFYSYTVMAKEQGYEVRLVKRRGRQKAPVDLIEVEIQCEDDSP